MLRRATRCPQLGQPQVSPGAVGVRVASGRPFRGTERGSWGSCHYRGAHRGRTLRTSSSCSGTLGCTGASVGTAQNTLGSKTNSQASHKLNKIQHYSWIEPDGYNFLMVTPPTVVRQRILLQHPVNSKIQHYRHNPTQQSYYRPHTLSGVSGSVHFTNT